MYADLFQAFEQYVPRPFILSKNSQNISVHMTQTEMFKQGNQNMLISNIRDTSTF